MQQFIPVAAFALSLAFQGAAARKTAPNTLTAAEKAEGWQLLFEVGRSMLGEAIGANCRSRLGDQGWHHPHGRESQGGRPHHAEEIRRFRAHLGVAGRAAAGTTASSIRDRGAAEVAGSRVPDDRRAGYPGKLGPNIRPPISTMCCPRRRTNRSGRRASGTRRASSSAARGWSTGSTARTC